MNKNRASTIVIFLSLWAAFFLAGYLTDTYIESSTARGIIWLFLVILAALVSDALGYRAAVYEWLRKRWKL